MVCAVVTQVHVSFHVREYSALLRCEGGDKFAGMLRSGSLVCLWVVW
jgi:hypothetical protein